MTYAVIDYHHSKWSHSIKIINNVGETNLYLPRFKEKKSIKYSKKVLNILNQYEIKNLVIHNELLKNHVFCDYLMENHKNIITGRNMYKVLCLRILKDVAVQMNLDIKQLKVIILVENYTAENVDLIKTIAKEVKSLTVVTTDKDKFDMLVKNLFQEYGIVLKVFEKNTTNFKNLHVLLNVDFPSYDMNKINISNQTLVICGFAKHYQVNSHFNGIVIKDIDIVDSENTHESMDELSLCEAKIYSYLRKVKENDRVFEREGFVIDGYYGENGKITLQEFKELGKIILDK